MFHEKIIHIRTKLRQCIIDVMRKHFQEFKMLILFPKFEPNESIVYPNIGITKHTPIAISCLQFHNMKLKLSNFFFFELQQ